MCPTIVAKLIYTFTFTAYNNFANPNFKALVVNHTWHQFVLVAKYCVLIKYKYLTNLFGS